MTEAKARIGNNPKDWIDETFESKGLEFMFASTPDVFGEDVICGTAFVGTRQVAFYATNPQIDRGFISSLGADKIIKIMDHAASKKLPIIAFLFSAGVSISEGITSGQAYAKIISRNISLSGVIPQFAVIIGATMGAAAYSATLMDLVIFNKARSYMMVTSPNVVKWAIGQNTTLQDLGGSEVHSSVTGIADFVEANIKEQLERVKELVKLIPGDRLSSENPTEEFPEPPGTNVAFNMEKILKGFVDGSKYHLYRKHFGKSMLCAFARVNGVSVGVIANQSTTNAGAIDSDASIKSTRFLRICDAFKLPLITLIDVPGFMPGSKEEQKGLLRHGANFCSAMQMHVPRIGIVIRRCYGAAAFVMLQESLSKFDLKLSLPKSRIAIMGYPAAKINIYANDPRSEEEKMNDYFENYESPKVALKNGLIDKIVENFEVREEVSRHLDKVFHDWQKFNYSPNPILP